MVTTICFLDDVERALKEVHRVLRPGGELIVGFVDMKSNLGTLYREEKTENVFYRMATFYSVNGVVTHMKEADFSNFTFVQTIFHYLDEIVSVEPIKPGHGRGAFVVVKGEK
jgi:ubiquinone/menaquinone biosynthesis C-methylase UbiE